ncbi:hypothetical protein HNR26_004607 [Rhizobium rosettiformans]|uniref:Uncharacterized protein n=2 Tax=Rhizobium rosettiformans TaxID=1368430 RepID=A0A4S8PK39_9HYPH|nr:hypothetical protein [Rhizobium rosettiformans]MBB5278506.1 hypothetical protein [Rhizobium rosettiformans]THV31078.1 hypothetical protein FAA86_22480 [Rhizobium rosettiformans W3]
MLGQITDHRPDPSAEDCDAVFEPSVHDDPHVGGVWSYEAVTSHADYFHVTAVYETTRAAAIRQAETAWPFPVNIYLYAKGSAPLG